MSRFVYLSFPQLHLSHLFDTAVFSTGLELAFDPLGEQGEIKFNKGWEWRSLVCHSPSHEGQIKVYEKE